MNWQEFSEDDLKEVMFLVKETKKIKSYKERKVFISSGIPTLSPKAKYLFAVFLYHSLFNSRWVPVDITNYFTLPLDTHNRATVEDFIELLRHYEKKKVRLTKDSKLFKFIKKCNRGAFKFFSELLERRLQDSLPITECQDLLDLESISLEDIYTPEERIYELMEDLVYPVAVSKVSTLNAEPKIYSKSLGRVLEYKIRENGIKVGSHIKASLVGGCIVSDYPKFVLAGIRTKIEDENKKLKPVNTRRKNRKTKAAKIRGENTKYEFHPFDCFESVDIFKKYAAGVEVTPYGERVAKLQEILRDNYVFGIEDNYVGFANNEQELRDEISKLLAKDQNGYLLFADENSSRTLKLHAKECARINTVIEEAWIEEEEVKGFVIWHNAVKHKVELDVGKLYPSLLKSLDLAKRKVLKCVYFRINDRPYYFPIEIDWKAKPWTPKGIRNEIILTACAVCGGDDYANDVGGICRSCSMNIYQILAKHGEDTWIPQTGPQNKKRKATGWHYTVMNLVKPRFQKYYLEAKEGGAWKFRPDPEAKAEYERNIATQKWNPNRKKLGIKNKK